MSNIKKVRPKPLDRATPVIKKAKTTDTQKVGVAHSMAAAAKASPEWVKAVDVQTAILVWVKAADAIGGNATFIAGLKSQLAIAEATQRGFRRTWRAATRQVLSTVSVYCDGSIDVVHGFGFDVLEHGLLGPLSVPVNLTGLPGKLPGDAKVSWSLGLARHGFLVQHATDIANPATYSATIPSTRTTFLLMTVQARGTSVFFRVAAIDPASKTGQTEWSAWVAATVK